jgi:hypothetical protein
MKEDLTAILNKNRPAREPEPMLFEIEPDWRDDWWGMPEFSMEEMTPEYRISVNFMTREDLNAFAERVGVKLTAQSDSMWYPKQTPLNGSFVYDGPKTDSKYPICIPSKGRAKHQKTGKYLDKMGVSYKFFVEETEGDEYIEALGEDKVVVMPFHDLGLGSIPARNFIWDWSHERGHKRHWTVDDNIALFARCHMNRRLSVQGGGFFRAMEDYVDRYENVVMAGPHDRGFVPDRSSRLTPVLLNSRIYSCILLDSSMPIRWRGRYNEDTDLSLRLLKSGKCTMLFRALLMEKCATVGVKNSKAMPGGNTDNVYNTGDARMAFAKSLEEQHPDVVKTVWKFNRWHHSVDYSPFKGNTPIMRKDVTPLKSVDNYGMELCRIKGDPIPDPVMETEIE